MSTDLEREGRAKLAEEALVESIAKPALPTSLTEVLLQGQADYHRGRALELEALAKVVGGLSAAAQDAIKQLVYREMRREGR